MGHERKEAECTCIKKPTMPTTMEGGREGGSQKESRGRSQTRQASPLQELWSLYFPTTAWPDSLACFPREHPGLLIARGELAGDGRKGAQPDLELLGLTRVTVLAHTEENNDPFASSNRVEEGLDSGPFKEKQHLGLG